MRGFSKVQEAEIISESKNAKKTTSGTNNMDPARKRRLNRAAIFLSILLIATYAVFSNWRFLLDEYTIWQNPPSSEVVDMAEKTTMNDYARRIFYASIPQLDDADAFNEHCNSQSSEMVLLGCFYQSKIYVFNIADVEIADAKYVTAAHEMLHAAYERLDQMEKLQINTWLDSMYKQLSDPELDTLMASYDKTEPGEKYNELHSIIGTEYADLSQELETYYAKYFTDQNAVANLSSQYKKVFKDLENAQLELDTKMSALLAKINDDIEDYDAQFNQLNIDITAFNDKNSAGFFTTNTQFNNERGKLLERQSALNTSATQIQLDINQYNTWVEEYNKLGGRARELSKSFDSRASAELNGRE